MSVNNGRVLTRYSVEVYKPKAFLPRYFAYVHSIAESCEYYSYGTLRQTEEHCIFHYTLRGRGVCSNASGVYDVLPGQGFLSIINDPLSGYAYPQDGVEEWEFVCFCFVGGNCMEIVREMIDQHGAVYSLPSEAPLLRMLCDEEHWQNAAPLSAIENARLFYDLISLLNRSVEKKPPVLFSYYVTEAKRLVGQRIEQNPTVEEIASEIGVSREYLSRVFRTEMGKSIKDYFKEERLLCACRLLKGTDLSVKQIAFRMCFSSSANFTRFFSSAMGIPPLAFRKNGVMPELS